MDTSDKRARLGATFESLVRRVEQTAGRSEFDSALLRFVIGVSDDRMFNFLSLPDPVTADFLDAEDFGVTRVATLGFLIASGTIEMADGITTFMAWLRRCARMAPVSGGPNLFTEPRLLFGVTTGWHACGGPQEYRAWLESCISGIIDRPVLADRVLAHWCQSQLDSEGAWERFERNMFSADPQCTRDVVAALWGVTCLLDHVSMPSRVVLRVRYSDWLRSLEGSDITMLDACGLAFALTIVNRELKAMSAGSGPGAGESPEIPPSTRTLIRTGSPCGVGEVRSGNSELLEIGGKASVLAVATEWKSHHGGLSTFNRDLCSALAAHGCRVVCVVPEIKSGERDNAMSVGVDLVAPSPQAGLVGTDALLLETPLPLAFVPHLILGHDRKTGPHAAALARRFPDAKLVQFIHTRPENIEWYKDALGEDDAAAKSEDRRRQQETLAAGAALVVGVGPELSKAASSLVYLASPRPPVHRLDPAFHSVTRPPDLPVEVHCLVLGRTEDSNLKGLDIAARALGGVVLRHKVPVSPRLIVRGAPPGTGVKLRKMLVRLARAQLEVEVREYSPDAERLQRDIMASSLVLMPSRSEGFGLVGLEAIATATPVLISDRSGLGVLLREQFGKKAEAFVVETHEELAVAAPEWERRIEAVLMNRDAAFAQAAELRTQLSNILTWEDAIQRLCATWEPMIRTAPVR